MQQKPKMCSRICMVSVKRIRLPEVSRRILEDGVEQRRLADSIAAVGIIQPLTVARQGLGFVLVNGGRRLQAAKIAGLRRVPCVVLRGGVEWQELWALAGDTGSEPLSCFDLAEAYARVLRTADGDALLRAVTGLREAELQQTLSLLRLREDQRRIAAAAGMGLRQAATLAALPEEERGRIFEGIADGDLSLAQQAEALRERLHVSPEEPRRRMGAVKDVRIFFNTLERAVEMMRQAGVQAETRRVDGEDYAELLVRIPSAAVETSVG